MDDYQQHLEQYQPTDELIATLLDQLPPLEPDTSPIPFDVPFFFMSPEYQNSPLGSTSSFSPHTPYSPLSSQIASDVQFDSGVQSLGRLSQLDANCNAPFLGADSRMRPRATSSPSYAAHTWPQLQVPCANTMVNQAFPLNNSLGLHNSSGQEPGFLRGFPHASMSSNSSPFTLTTALGGVPLAVVQSSSPCALSSYLSPSTYPVPLDGHVPYAPEGSPNAYALSCSYTSPPAHFEPLNGYVPTQSSPLRDASSVLYGSPSSYVSPSTHSNPLEHVSQSSREGRSVESVPSPYPPQPNEPPPTRNLTDYVPEIVFRRNGRLGVSLKDALSDAVSSIEGANDEIDCFTGTRRLYLKIKWPGYEQFGTVTQLKPPKNGEKRETRSEVLAHVAKQVARFMRKSKNYMKLPMKLDDTWLIGPYTTPESVIIERIRRIPGGSTAWDFEPAPLRLS